MHVQMSSDNPHLSIRELLNWSTEVSNDESSELEFKCWQTPQDNNNNSEQEENAGSTAYVNPMDELNEFQKAVMKTCVARESTEKKLKNWIQL